MTTRTELITRHNAPLNTPSDLDRKVVTDISEALNALLADVFCMY
jgi:hypothetical protein